MSKFDAGSTSKSTNIYITDALGNPKTGLVFNSAGAGAYYHRPGSAPVAITLATLASVTAPWSSGGFIEVDATNHPGLYRLDIPNAALASGVDEVFISLKFTGALIQPLKIILEAKTLTAITTAVLDELLSGHAVSGSVGAGISTLLTNVSAVKAKTDLLILADIAAAVCDELLAGHTTSNSLGKAITDILTNSGRLDVTLSTRADGSVWTSGKAAYLDAAITSRAAASSLTTTDGKIDLIKAKTDLLTLAAIAAAVLDELLTSHVATNTLGKAINDLVAGVNATLSQPTLDAIANNLLKKDLVGTTGEARRSVLNAIRPLLNKVDVVGVTQRTYKEDDTIVAFTATVTTATSTDAIVGIDPN